MVREISQIGFRVRFTKPVFLQQPKISVKSCKLYKPKKSKQKSQKVEYQLTINIMKLSSLFLTLISGSTATDVKTIPPTNRLENIHVGLGQWINDNFGTVAEPAHPKVNVEKLSSKLNAVVDLMQGRFTESCAIHSLVNDAEEDAVSAIKFFCSEKCREVVAYNNL